MGEMLWLLVAHVTDAMRSRTNCNRDNDRSLDSDLEQAT